MQMETGFVIIASQTVLMHMQQIVFIWMQMEMGSVITVILLLDIITLLIVPIRI